MTQRTVHLMTTTTTTTSTKTTTRTRTKTYYITNTGRYNKFAQKADHINRIFLNSRHLITKIYDTWDDKKSS